MGDHSLEQLVKMIGQIKPVETFIRPGSIAADVIVVADYIKIRAAGDHLCQLVQIAAIAGQLTLLVGILLVVGVESVQNVDG